MMMLGIGASGNRRRDSRKDQPRCIPSFFAGSGSVFSPEPRLAFPSFQASDLPTLFVFQVEIFNGAPRPEENDEVHLSEQVFLLSDFKAETFNRAYALETLRRVRDYYEWQRQ